MTTEIKIGHSIYKISCPENEVEQLLQVGNSLNKKFKNLSAQLGNLDEKTILVYLALMLEAELEKASKSQNDEDDIYDAVSENIENIAQYIEKLDKKIAGY